MVTAAIFGNAPRIVV